MARDQLVDELLFTIRAWNAEGLGTCPEIEHTNYPDAWAEVSRLAREIREASESK